MGELKLSIVMFSEKVGGETVWIAQCLEIDLAAQASKMADLPYEFQRTFVALIASCIHAKIDPFDHLRSIGQAPPHYFEMFERGMKMAKQDVPRMHTSEYLPTGLALADRELRVAA